MSKIFGIKARLSFLLTGKVSVLSDSEFRVNVKRKRKRIHEDIRKRVFNKHGNKCFYCENTLTVNELTIDHYIPFKVEKNNREENLVPACKVCNSDKGCLNPLDKNDSANYSTFILKAKSRNKTRKSILLEEKFRKEGIVFKKIQKDFIKDSNLSKFLYEVNNLETQRTLSIKVVVAKNIEKEGILDKNNKIIWDKIDLPLAA